jgi:class 3 adenylate cyclase
MARIRRKNLGKPDERRSFPGMRAGLVQVGPLTIGRAALEPGWRWSTHVGPRTGDRWCQVHHLQLLVSGRLGVAMDDGETAELAPDDVFDVPPGHDAWVIGDEPAVLIDMYGNAAGFGLPREHLRTVTTLLMTDIVGSTALAGRLGDTAWRQRLGGHDRLVRGHLERSGGREVNTTGDGFLATFASAVAAVRCGAAIRDAVRSLDLEVRVGVHTGEVEVRGEDIGGVAVHAAARVMALAGPSEVLCSATTRALVEGSGLSFDARGSHVVKGFEDPITVYALRG